MCVKIFDAGRELIRAAFRNTILILAGMNALLMLPSWFFLKARLPRRQPPPLRALKMPFKETRYLMLVLGSVMIMMWCVKYNCVPLRVASLQSQLVRSVLQRSSTRLFQPHLVDHPVLRSHHPPGRIHDRSGYMRLPVRPLGCVPRMDLHCHSVRHYHSRLLDWLADARTCRHTRSISIRPRQRSMDHLGPDCSSGDQPRQGARDARRDAMELVGLYSAGWTGHWRS